MKRLTLQRENCLALIRLRGHSGMHPDPEYAFGLMHLTRKHHATLIKSTASNLGAILRIKDYATWGEVSKDMVSLLLQKRGMLRGKRRLTEEFVKDKLGFHSIEAMAKAIYNFEVDFWNLNDLKPIFRLHPPRKGFKGSIKKPYPKGELGYRGHHINQLISKMI